MSHHECVINPGTLSGYLYSGLKRYDLVTQEDQKIYIVEDSKNQSLTGYYGDDSEVYFVVTTSLEKEESVLFHYELNTNEYESILTAEGRIGVYRDLDTNKIKATTDTQSFYIENGILQAAEAPDNTATPLYEQESHVKLTSNDGTIIEISKEFKNDEFYYTIGNTTGVITALSDYNAEKSGVSNNFIIEDDIQMVDSIQG